LNPDNGQVGFLALQQWVGTSGCLGDEWRALTSQKAELQAGRETWVAENPGKQIPPHRRGTEGTGWSLGELLSRAERWGPTWAEDSVP
jgi:hypothetical protein